MSTRRTERGIDYRLSRAADAGPPAELSLRYGADGAPVQARPGSLGYFLAERYCLYTLDENRRVLRGDIHHPPWPLQPAVAEIERNSMGTQIGQRLEGEP